jgi:hypothetical protein
VSKDRSDALAAVHKANARVLLALVALHVGAVVLHLVVERQNLVTAMVTGRKRWPAGIEAPEPGRARPALAVALFLAACAAVALVVHAPGLGRTGEAP